MNDTRPVTDDYDVLIIGAGMSGLAAGIRLALFGKRVVICERHYTIGGLNSFYRKHGRNFEVGLHAMTNVPQPGDRRAVWRRLLRQLQIEPEQLALIPQRRSAIIFPQATLTFSNHPDCLRQSIAEVFPDQRDGFDRLAAGIPDYQHIATDDPRSARQVLAEHFSEPLLCEMLLCPLMYYGSSTPHDMPWGVFAILFRSIFLEGLGRPRGGIRELLKVLVKQFRGAGGELRLRTGIARLHTRGKRVEEVELDDGTRLRAGTILSSAGGPETYAMVEPPSADRPRQGEISFCESISVLPQSLFEDQEALTAVFFNHASRFEFQSPDDTIDCRSGVISIPDAFVEPDPRLDPMVRVSVLADYRRWAAIRPEEYNAAKEDAYRRMTETAVRVLPDFRKQTIAHDVFTPTTIERYTGRTQGAVYGSPDKHRDGTTPWENLFLCGTDQGLVGIVGAIISGVNVANRCLM